MSERSLSYSSPGASPLEQLARPARATPLTVEDRQAMIIGAVTPLVLERGREVTSKQFADAAGLAEGTIFRAFGDKETLIQAVLDKLLDPEPLHRDMRSIDSALPLREKVQIILGLLQHRFGTVFQMMAVLQPDHRPPESHEHRHEFSRLIAQALEPDEGMLNLVPERVAHVLRLAAFATSFPRLNAGLEFDLDELTDIVLNGIAGRSRHEPSNEPKESHLKDQNTNKS